MNLETFPTKSSVVIIVMIVFSFKESLNESFLNPTNPPLIFSLLEMLIFTCWKMVIPLGHRDK